MVVVAIPYIPSHVSVKTDSTRRWSLLLLLLLLLLHLLPPLSRFVDLDDKENGFVDVGSRSLCDDDDDDDDDS